MNPKSLGPAFSLFRCAGTDAALVKDRVAEEPNRNRNRRNCFFPKPKAEPGQNRNRRNRFPGTETGTVLSCINCPEAQKKPFLHWNRRNRRPEPFHPQTVTEPNRTAASMQKSNLLFAGAHPIENNRAALKGTNLRGQTPICGFLRVPAVFCGFLRKSAVSFENLRFPNALFSRKRRESAKICENLRKSAFGLSLPP